MKNVLVLILCVGFLVIGSTAYAGEKTCENSNFWNAVANECSPHTVDTDTHADIDTEAGIGADVVIWQNETDKVKFIEEVVAEYRHDFNNDSDSIYGVVRVNLWHKIKNLFNKGE